MSVSYEWFVEHRYLNGGDGEIYFEDTYAGVMEEAQELHRSMFGEDPLSSRIGLRRHEDDGSTWDTYVYAGTLDPLFRGAAGQTICRTPKRFIREVERYHADDDDFVCWVGLPEGMPSPDPFDREDDWEDDS